MKLDSYTVIARIFPAVLTALPFFVFNFFFLRQVLGDFLGSLLKLQIVSDITVSFVFLFFLIQVNRYISKEFFERIIFDDGLGLPTTVFLLHSNSHFTTDYTQKIHSKIKKDFGIIIPSYAEEIRDRKNTQRIMAEAVNHIRARTGKGNLLGQHNAEYGFSRNLIGGSVVGTVMSIINMVIFSLFYLDSTAFVVSLILAATYLVIIILARYIVFFFGNRYAEILIQEYMAG